MNWPLFITTTASVTAIAATVVAWIIFRKIKATSLDVLQEGLTKLDATTKAQADAAAQRAAAFETRLAVFETRIANAERGLIENTGTGQVLTGRVAELGPLEAKVEEISGDVTKLSGLARYDIVQRLARDGVSYAEQAAKNAERAKKAKFANVDKANSALGYAMKQAEKVGAPVEREAVRLAIEAQVQWTPEDPPAPSADVQAPVADGVVQ